MNKNKKVNKNINITSYVFLTILAIIIAGGVFATIEMVTSGAEVANLEKEEVKLIEKNRLLSQEFAKMSSLQSFEKMADSLGFIKPTEILYVVKPEGVAAKLP